MTDEGTPRRRILLAEDSAIIGLELADSLESEGFEVAGPFTTCAAAEAWLGAHEPAAAILDNTLKDGPCEQLAGDLRRRGVPFIVYSGHAREAEHPAVFQGVPWVTKPAPSELLLKVLRRCMGSAEVPRPAR
jgi:DNA-binding response OmpR family regulator